MHLKDDVKEEKKKTNAAPSQEFSHAARTVPLFVNDVEAKAT